MLFLFFFNASAQEEEVVADANNPIDPNPTLGLFNRAYSNEKSMSQLIANATFDKWFVRFSTEVEFNYNHDNVYKGGNLLISRLFESKDEQHKFGAGIIGSYMNPKGFAGGVNFVSVSKFGKWKVISLTTLQGGDDIALLEFQPGLYRDLKNGWYLRSHPRMLFDLEENYNEVPIGAGFGKIYKANNTLINLLIEPQYDFAQKQAILYGGIKFLF